MTHSVGRTTGQTRNMMDLLTFRKKKKEINGTKFRCDIKGSGLSGYIWIVKYLIGLD